MAVFGPSKDVNENTRTDKEVQHQGYGASAEGIFLPVNRTFIDIGFSNMAKFMDFQL